MHSTFRAVLAGSLLALLLAACGGSKNEKPGPAYTTPGVPKGDTLKQKLEVPPDLITPATDDRFVVPDTTSNGSATYSSYVADRQPASASAPVSSANPQNGNIRIDRAGTERWLVVKGADIATLWPKIEAFWRDNGFVLVNEDRAAGLMETEWAENHAKVLGDPIQDLMRKSLGTFYSNGERDKFRIRLEATAQPGAVEIYVSHRGLIEVLNGNNADGTHWERRPNDPYLEAAMLQRLMVALGTEEKVAEKVVAESKAAPLPARAKLENAADGTLQLTVNDTLDRAWRQVGLALDRTGVVVEDRDRAKGLYFVRYIVTEDPTTENERKGWFARLFSWGGKKPAGTNQFRVEVVAGSGASSTAVHLLTKDGAKASATSSKQILSLLLDELK
jgi:outer membrane protein assembly factor BamC